MRDFPGDFQKLRKKFCPLGGVTSQLPPATSSPPFLWTIKGTRLLRSLVFVLPGGTLSTTSSWAVVWLKGGLPIYPIGWGGLAGLVGGLFLARRVLSKGLARRSMVTVPGLRRGQSIQWGLMGQRTGGRVEVEEGLFFKALSLCSCSSKTLETSLTFSSSVSFFHSWIFLALGPNRSWPPTYMTNRQSLSRWGRSTAWDSRVVQRLSIWMCAYSPLAVAVEPWDMSWASRMVKLTLWRRSSTTGASFWIVFLATEARK